MTTQTFPQYCITLLALPPLAFFFFFFPEGNRFGSENSVPIRVE